eukprot:TRINITY_DN7635_c0_g1_i1.p1 TRINITY_DN7635_c0_g1~~TRINITY_DN7635_c0_g1_i1.p1  ORF type:complete len:456 (+),score=80.51 TRINITY_DN7635_c0_g1_i1:91-1458(+)
MAQQLMPVYVALGDEMHCVEVSHLATVGELAASVPRQAATGVAIYFGGEMLDSTATLADAGIGAEARVEARVRGAVVIDTDGGRMYYGLDSSVRPSFMRAVVGYPRHPVASAGTQRGALFVGKTAFDRRGILTLHEIGLRGRIEGAPEHIARLWDMALVNLVAEDKKADEFPFLVAEGFLATACSRETIARAVFEGITSVPGLSIVPSPVLALAAAGCKAGIVLDCSGDYSAAAAVTSGRVLGQVQFKQGGRESMVTKLSGDLAVRGYSFQTSAEMEILRHILDTLCFVPPDPDFAKDMEEQYELPDGQVIHIGSEMYKVADALFSEEAGSVLLNLVVNAAQSCPELREELLRSVVICGRGAQLRGFGARLQNDLRKAAGPQCAVVNLPDPAEAAHDSASPTPGPLEALVWQGGALMGRGAAGAAGVGSMTAAEFDEKGPAGIHSKCAPLPEVAQ